MCSITRINYSKCIAGKYTSKTRPQFSTIQKRFHQIKTENNNNKEDDCSFAKFDLQRAQEESERCLLCVDAPCSKACPAGTMPDKFIRQLRFLNTKGAAETILDNNALGGICGTVCPVESLCEGSCVRSKIDSPIQIGKLQRFLHDFGIEEKIDLPPTPSFSLSLSGSLSDLSMSNRKKVGIVGSGPAGLSAARELVRRGALVTIFESSDRPGGILLYGISPTRLDDRLINEEIKRIEEMGVVIKTNVTIKAEEIPSLLNEFDALFLSPGLQRGNSLSHLLSDQNSTEKVEGVTTALEFLRSANIDKKSEEGFASKLVKNKNVVVIGGGSVAMDAANTSLWLGAKRAYSLSLEDLKNLPASAEEINLARHNGVIFRPETRLTKLHSKNGKLVSIDVVEVSTSSTSPPSSSSSSDLKRGKVQLSYSDREGSEGRMLADTLIFAIGQSFDEEGSSLLHFINHSNNNPNNKIDERKERWIIVDKSNYQTQIKKIYAGGDAIRGGDCVVNAVQDGKLFAQSFLPGIEPEKRNKRYPSLETSFCGVKFPNPFTLSSSPVSNTAEMCARAFEAGFGGVYYKTLNLDDKFHIDHPSPRLGSVDFNHQKVAIGIQNLEQISDRPLKDNLKDITWLRKNYPNNVVGVSIMGYSEEDWFLLAKMAEEAGAQIIELNFSCPQMARSDAGHHVGQSFDLIERYTRAAKKGSSSAPIVAKMTPNLTKIEPACIAAKQGGADAISAINTIRSISHINLQNFTGIPTVEGKSSISGFSGPMARPIALRFIAEIAKSKDIQLPISGMGGIFTWKDAAEFLLLGASNLQLTTAVMRFGYRVVEDLIDGLQKYLISVGAKSVHEIVGKALPTLVDPAQLSLKKEVYSIINQEKCVGCGQCVATCNDAAAQAIHLEKREDGSSFAVVNQTRCIGCTMCANVCPVDLCVSFNTRDRITHPL